MKQPTNATGEAQTSTVQPNYSTQGTTIDAAFETTDGYIWKYMYELSASRAATFLSTNWIPIEYVDSSDQATNAVTQNQFNVEDAAISGQILGVIVTNGTLSHGIFSKIKCPSSPAQITFLSSAIPSLS